jgi:hypothetical protein
MTSDLDLRIERAARQRSAFADVRLSRAEVQRIDQALRLLRAEETETVKVDPPKAIANAVRTWKETRRL